MYGNGGFYNGMYPNLMMNNYNNANLANQPNSTYGNENGTNTQHKEHVIKNDTKDIKENPNTKRNKKNVDTYKNVNTPTLKTRFSNLKNSVSNFFSRFKKPNKNIEFPFYRDQTTEDLNSK